MSYKSEANEDPKYGKTISIFKVEDEAEKRVVSFGIKKAQAIVAQMEEIKKFVEDNTNDEDNNQ